VRARWVTTRAAVWLSPDPLPWRLRRNGTGLYRYVDARPTLAVDPSGLDWFEGQPPQPFPRVTEPPPDFGRRQPTLFERIYCPNAPLGVLTYFCGPTGLVTCPVLRGFVEHWYEESGSTVLLSDSVMTRLLILGQHGPQCHGYARELAAFAEAKLTKCPRLRTRAEFVRTHRYYWLPSRSESANGNDPELYNALGNSSVWFRGDVRCEFDPLGDIFHMTYKYWVTDQFIGQGKDKEKQMAYACHEAGLLRDFRIKGAWSNENRIVLRWRRKKFDAAYPRAPHAACIVSGEPSAV
jgi:hypothetical protein